MNFGLMQHHKWSITEIENMMPWERDVYVQLLMNWLQEESDRVERENNELKR
mgnify:FL=1|jgi:hypothetical protein|tara:strand:- start:1160 stop:1315 length:156 start_codon:yes stop_codon:yes gene_type:complete